MKATFATNNPSDKVSRSTEWYRTTRGRRYEQVSRHRSDASQRGIEWSLTDEEYAAALGDGTCHYCAGDITTGGVGLDRKDSAVGYTAGNVVACCYSCNLEKSGTISYDEYVWLWKFRTSTAEAHAEVARRRLGDGRVEALGGAGTGFKDHIGDRATRRECGIGMNDPWPELPARDTTVFAWRTRLGITQKEASALLKHLGQHAWNYREVQRSEHMPFVSSEDRKQLALDQSKLRAERQAAVHAAKRWHVICAVCGEAGHNKRRHKL